MPQYFKGDDFERKLSGAADEVLTRLKEDMRAWFDGAYASSGLGEVLYDNNLVPLARAVTRDIFIKNYGAILEKWEYAGTFESYLYVFMQIFGPQTTIVFDRLAPGALEINITTSQTQLYRWLATVDQSDYVADHNGNRINLRQVKGIGNFYEVQSVLDSLSPAGIFLRVNFTLLGE